MKTKTLFKKTFLLLVLLVYTGQLLAQCTSWTHKWGSPMDDIGQQMIVTSDGGAAIVGHIVNLSTSDDDIYIVKTAADGTTEWTRQYGGDDVDFAYGIQEVNDMDGPGYMVMAYWSSAPQYQHTLLMRLDTGGDTLWCKWIPDNIAYSLHTTSDGGYLLSGTSALYPITTNFIMKTDTDGNVEWEKNYAPHGYDAPGLMDDETDESIECIDGGYVYVVSMRKAVVPNDYDAVLIRTDNAGDSLWTRHFGRTGTDHADEKIYSVSQAPDSGFVLMFSNEDTLKILRTDRSGNFIWQQNIAGYPYSYLGYGSYRQSRSPEGNVIVSYGKTNLSTGQKESWMSKLNINTGALLQSTMLLSDTYSYSANVVIENTPGCYTLGGTWENSVPATSVPPYQELFIARVQDHTMATTENLSGPQRYWVENPFHSTPMIYGENVLRGNYCFYLLTITGQVLLNETGSFSGGKFQLPVNNFATGPYLLEIVDPSGQKICLKLIAQ